MPQPRGIGHANSVPADVVPHEPHAAAPSVQSPPPPPAELDATRQRCIARSMLKLKKAMGGFEISSTRVFHSVVHPMDSGPAREQVWFISNTWRTRCWLTKAVQNVSGQAAHAVYVRSRNVMTVMHTFVANVHARALVK